MEIKIRIKTPKGNAIGLEKKLRNWILPLRTNLKKVESNEDDSQIIWTIEGDSKKIYKVTRNVACFDAIMTNVMGNKRFKKRARKEVGEEGLKQLEDMLKNHTSCEVIKRDIQD